MVCAPSSVSAWPDGPVASTRPARGWPSTRSTARVGTLALLRAGLADATAAAEGDGRFAIEAAIAGLHSSARSFADTDWDRIVALYTALEQRWPSPAVHVARLAATAHGCIARGLDTSEVERELRTLEAGAAAYAQS